MQVKLNPSKPNRTRLKMSETYEATDLGNCQLQIGKNQYLKKWFVEVKPKETKPTSLIDTDGLPRLTEPAKVGQRVLICEGEYKGRIGTVVGDSYGSYSTIKISETNYWPYNFNQLALHPSDQPKPTPTESTLSDLIDYVNDNSSRYSKDQLIALSECIGHLILNRK